MTTYTDRIVLVFPIAEKNRPAAASLQTLEIVNGREFETLVPLDPSAVAQYASEFNLPLVTENDSLKAQIETLQARIAELEAGMPWDVRVIDSQAFVKRLSSDEMLMLFSSSDATTQKIAETIEAYVSNDWPILFDSSEFQQLIGYLVQSRQITVERASEITRDSTRDESYAAG